MKDGRTHLAYKAEHVVDLKSDLVLAAEIRPATAADTVTMVDSVIQARVNLDVAGSAAGMGEGACGPISPTPRGTMNGGGPTSQRSTNKPCTTIAAECDATKASSYNGLA